MLTKSLCLQLLCLGEQSLLLLSFSLVPIDSLRAVLGQLMHCTTIKQPIVQVKLQAQCSILFSSLSTVISIHLRSFLLSAAPGQGLPVLTEGIDLAYTREVMHSRHPTADIQVGLHAFVQPWP